MGIQFYNTVFAAIEDALSAGKSLHVHSMILSEKTGSPEASIYTAHDIITHVTSSDIA